MRHRNEYGGRGSNIDQMVSAPVTNVPKHKATSRDLCTTKREFLKKAREVELEELHKDLDVAFRGADFIRTTVTYRPSGRWRNSPGTSGESNGKRRKQEVWHDEGKTRATSPRSERRTDRREPFDSLGGRTRCLAISDCYPQRYPNTLNQRKRPLCSGLSYSFLK